MTEIDDNLDAIDIRTEPEKREHDKILSLQADLASLQPGITVIIERLRPSWCKGQLERITVGEEGLDLDYLIRTWGGHLLSLKIIGSGNRIRGSHSVELYTFEPRRYGKRLKQPNRSDDDDPAPSSAPVSQSEPDPMLPKIIDMITQQHRSEIDTLKTILLSQQQQQQAPTSAPANVGIGNIGDVVKIFAAMEKLKTMFRDDQANVDPESQFPGQIMSMMQMFLDSRDSPTRVISPRQNPSPTPAPAPPAPAPASPPMGPRHAIEQINRLPPDSAADALITALGTMPPNKQAATIQQFMLKFNSEMPAYQSGPIEEDEYEDDDDDDDDDGQNETEGEHERQK